MASETPDDDRSGEASRADRSRRAPGADAWLDRGLAWALLIGAGVSMLLRFSRLDLSPFNSDEPAFLLAAQQQLATGELATISPLRGNVGVSYGPSVMWWYGLVQWLTGSPDAQVAITSMCLLVTAAQITLALAAGRFVAPRRPLLGCALSLSVLSTAPYLGFWSRLAWDQLTLAVPCLVVALLCHRRPGPVRIALVGLLLGYGASSHPMILTFALGVVLVLAREQAPSWRRLGLTGLALGVPALLINVPYLVALSQTTAHPSPGREHGLEAWRFVEIFRPSSLWRIDYFFDGDWQAFVDFAGVGALASPLGPITLALAMGLTAWGLVHGHRTFRDERRRIVELAVFLIFAHPIYLAIAGTGPHPHYQFPVAWVVPVAIAMLADHPPEHRRRALLACGAVVTMALAMGGFSTRWKSFIAERDGTRGVHYSITLQEQLRAVDRLCDGSRAPLTIENATLSFPQALAYHARFHPGCAGRAIAICPPGRCPHPHPGEVRVTLAYRGPRGGALAVQRHGAPHARPGSDAHRP